MVIFIADAFLHTDSLLLCDRVDSAGDVARTTLKSLVFEMQESTKESFIVHSASAFESTMAMLILIMACWVIVNSWSHCCETEKQYGMKILWIFLTFRKGSFRAIF